MPKATTTKLLVFAGHIERDERYVYAVCDTVPMVTHGKDEDEANRSMTAALSVYQDTLRQRGELEAAIEHFRIQVIDIDDAVALLMRPAPATSRPTFDTLLKMPALA